MTRVPLIIIIMIRARKDVSMSKAVWMLRLRTGLKSKILMEVEEAGEPEKAPLPCRRACAVQYLCLLGVRCLISWPAEAFLA